MIESLINDGGQNPVEASRLGCKILHGPYVSNFNEIYEYLKSLGVTSEINNSEELYKSLVEEFKKGKNITNSDLIIKKIDDYGTSILNNVIKEIKIYINIQR